jgi:hypothetical protein
MAIDPVPVIGPAEQATSAAVGPRVHQVQAPASLAEHSFQFGSGTAPESENHRPLAAAASHELPEDEVQLLRDQQTNGDVVIKYLDPSGNLVLQVPSTEVLGVARSIIQEFAAESAARARANATSSASDGGGNHGH